MVTVSRIHELIKNEISGFKIDQHLLEVEPASPREAGVSSFCYISPLTVSAGALPEFDGPVGLVIASDSQIGTFSGAINWIVTENPRYVFAKICDKFFARRNGSVVGGAENVRGLHGEDSGIYVGSEVQFDRGFSGSGVRIFPGVRVLGGTFVRAGSVLGSDGFGFERKTNESTPTRIHHYGGLIIGENCEIGSNVTIDRGTFEDTAIGNNVKIDNNVHIAHNVKVGEGTMIAAGTVISGSTYVGAFAWLGPNVTLRNKIRVGDFAHVSLGSVVLKDVDPHQKVFGNPARIVS